MLADACGDLLLDLHSDPDHHRSVFTLGGPSDDVQEAARSLARVAVATLDLSRHSGAHPRFGVVDVVPFVPLHGPDLGPAVVARDAFADWAGRSLGLPCFLYGPYGDGPYGDGRHGDGPYGDGPHGDGPHGDGPHGGDGVRTLPEVRRGAFSTFRPDTGPETPHPTAGAAAVGARPVLVAYNIWLADASLDVARRVAAALRSPAVRALGFQLEGGVQVSCNLLDPTTAGPAQVYDRVAALLRAAASEQGSRATAAISRSELVGLLPVAALDRTPPSRWPELDLAPDRTIEARLEARHRTRTR